MIGGHLGSSQSARLLLIVAVLHLGILKPVKANLIAYFPFDGNFHDVAGGRVGIAFAPPGSGEALPSFSSDIPVNGGVSSLNLREHHDVVTVDIGGSDKLLGPFTIAAWVNYDYYSAVGTFFGTRSPNEFGFGLALNQVIDNLFTHSDIGNGGSWIRQSADSVFPWTPNAWYHVAYVVMSTGYEVYRNGQFVGGGSYPSGVPLLFDLNHDIAIGAVNINGDDNFNGLMDELRIYDEALSASQIASLAGVPEPSCLALAAIAGIGFCGPFFHRAARSHQSK